MMKRKELRIARPLVFGIFPQTGAINAVRRVKPGEYIYQYRAGCSPIIFIILPSGQSKDSSGGLGTVLIYILLKDFPSRRLNRKIKNSLKKWRVVFQKKLFPRNAPSLAAVFFVIHTPLLTKEKNKCKKRLTLRLFKKWGVTLNRDQDNVAACSRCGGEILGGKPGDPWQCRHGGESASVISVKRSDLNGVCADNSRGVFPPEFNPGAFSGPDES